VGGGVFQPGFADAEGDALQTINQIANALVEEAKGK
jgi:hypothetical protein